jgi:hypothetical protein
MDFTYGPLNGDLEVAFSKISEACSCVDECLRLLKAGLQRNQAAKDRDHDSVLLHADRIKKHAAEIQVVLIALSDGLTRSGDCSLRSKQDQPSAFGKQCGLERFLTGAADLAAGVDKLRNLIKADGYDRPDHEVISLHLDRMKQHVAAIKHRIDNPPGVRPDEGHPLQNPAVYGFAQPTLVECEYAFDAADLRAFSVRDLQDAIDFDTGLKATFGFSIVDEEVREPLITALEVLQADLDAGNSIDLGLVMRMLKTFIKGHPRAFGRYFKGDDPWPRPSTVIQVEIDRRMPDALEWLRYELNEAIEAEKSEEGN